MLNTILWIVGIIAFVWIVYDVLAVQKRMPTLHKVLWIIAGFFFSIITAVVYYFVVKK